MTTTALTQPTTITSTTPPDPWAAVLADPAIFLSDDVKLAWAANARSRWRRFALPLMRPWLRLALTVVYYLRAALPAWFVSVRSIDPWAAFLERWFIRREVAWIATRHFYLSTELARFVAANTPGLNLRIDHLAPRTNEDMKHFETGLIFTHQVRRLSLLKNVNDHLRRHGPPARRDALDFSMVTDGDFPFELSPPSPLNVLDLESLSELVVLAGAVFADSETFFNNTTLEFQSDELLGQHIARILGDDTPLFHLSRNRTPLVPVPFHDVAQNLFYHVYYVELLHALLVRHKRAQT